MRSRARYIEMRLPTIEGRRVTSKLKLTQGAGVPDSAAQAALDNVAAPHMQHCILMAPSTGFLFKRALTTVAHTAPTMVGPLLETAPDYLHGTSIGLWRTVLIAHQIWGWTRYYMLLHPQRIFIGRPELEERKHAALFWPGGYVWEGIDRLLGQRWQIENHLLQYHTGARLTGMAGPGYYELRHIAHLLGLSEETTAEVLEAGKVTRKLLTPPGPGRGIGILGDPTWFSFRERWAARFCGALHYPRLYPTMTEKGLQEYRDMTAAPGYVPGLRLDEKACFYGGPSFWGNDFAAWKNPLDFGAPLDVAYSEEEVLRMIGRPGLPTNPAGEKVSGESLHVKTEALPDTLKYVVRLSEKHPNREVGVFRADSVRSTRGLGGASLWWTEPEQSPEATIPGHSGSPLFTLNGRYIGVVARIERGGLASADISAPLIRFIEHERDLPRRHPPPYPPLPRPFPDRPPDPPGVTPGGRDVLLGRFSPPEVETSLMTTVPAEVERTGGRTDWILLLAAVTLITALARSPK